MTINLKPETERLVQEELQNGHFRTVDEMIVEGVQARREGKQLSREVRRKTRAEARAHIREQRPRNPPPSAPHPAQPPRPPGGQSKPSLERAGLEGLGPGHLSPPPPAVLRFFGFL